MRARDAEARSLAVVTPPVRQADDPRHDVGRHLDRRLHRAHARRHAGRAGRPEAAAARVVGVHEQRAAVAALHQAKAVVHPAVVRAQVAPADQPQPVVRRDRRRTQPLEVAHEALGREPDAPVARVEPLRQARLERAQVDPVRHAPQPPQRQPAAAAVSTSRRGRSASSRPRGRSVPGGRGAHTSRGRASRAAPCARRGAGRGRA